ncbi:hypothetical protein [Candidatus Terasakiella magnetica]|uniref:hypothetical protein n=1 Tax=Candidatus Terasakiella magnetica TaxID=1867952 RepID=UPI000F81621A|nr:hypothetical protein [Candidatus Terasakiella magnetica]
MKDGLKNEIRTVRTLGLRKIVSNAFSQQKATLDQLPFQKILTKKFPSLEFGNIEELMDGLGCDQDQIATGGHTVYLSPQEWSNSVLSELKESYPAHCGMKIFRQLGDETASVLCDDIPSSYLLKKNFTSHSEQVLIFAYLHAQQIAPRLIDIFLLEGKTQTAVCYVVQHIERIEPSVEQYDRVVGKLKSLAKQGDISLNNVAGFQDHDFSLPNCNRNLYADERTGQAYYIDPHNFEISNYEKFLKETALTAQNISHFGDKSVLLGGDYLYQAIPGLNMMAKREPVKRMAIFNELLEQAGESLENRNVIDIGCNMGLAGAHYLRAGAHWVHGLDFEKVADQAEKVMSAIGCTRFSTTKGEMSAQTSLRQVIEQNLHLDKQDNVISYLSIRGHIDWIEELKDIPWATMLYEGHQAEGIEENHAFISHLNDIVPVTIKAETVAQDGSSEERYLAVLHRTIG